MNKLYLTVFIVCMAGLLLCGYTMYSALNEMVQINERVKQ